MLQRICVFVCLLFPLVISGQTHIRDTSFNTKSAYLKEKKKWPYIRIASPLNSKDVKVKRDIVFDRYDRNLLLDVFYPKKRQAKPLPAVVLVFGGGWRSGNRGMNDAMAEYLASQGYVAVSIDYRLSTEALYPAAVYDVKSGIRWTRANAKKFNIDTSRIAVLGCSAGGQLAALTGTTNGRDKFEGKGANRDFSSKVHAVVNIDGVLAFIHPESGETGGTPEKPSAANLWFGGTHTENPQPWQEASALNHVDKNTVPFLFVSSSIPRFHAGRDDMIEKLNALGIYSEVHTLDDTPHPFWLFHPWFNPTMEFTLNFLNKIFKPADQK